MDPSVRTTRSRVEQLLRPEVVEVGSSGRLWTRDEMLTALAGDLSPERVEVLLHVLRGVRLAADVVHPDDRTAVGWHLWFHQGTPEAG